MGGYADEAFGISVEPRLQRMAQPQLIQTQAAGGGYADEAFGLPTKKQAVAPKIVDDPSRTLGFVDQAKGSFAINEPQWIANAAKTLYPNDPQAVSRFGKTPDGQIYHTGDDGRAYAVTPQSGMRRVANLGQGVGPAVPAVAGTLAGIVGLPFGGLPAVGTAAAGATAGEVMRQNIGNAILPDTQETDMGQAVKEGVLSGAGQAIGGGITKAASRFAAPDIANYSPLLSSDLMRKAESIGVRLTPAEATGLNSLIGEQKRLMGVPQSANIMGEFIEGRNKEAMGAWRNFTNSIAPPRDATALGRRAQETADTLVSNAQTARTAAVSPYYDAAEQQIRSVNPGDVVRFIEQQLPTAKGSERKALEYVSSQLRRTGEDTIDMSFRGLDGAKKAIDALLENQDLATRQGIDRTAFATLTQVRDRIVNAIDNVGGATGPYAQGRAEYGRISEEVVNPLQEVLAPILRSNGANSSIQRAAQSLVDPAQRSPEVVARARAAIEPQYPQLWQGIKRQFLEQTAYQALQENAKGAVSNVGGNIAKRVGNDAVEANMRAAMTRDEFIRYRDIVDVFRATGKALDANSDTAFKAEAITKAKDKAGGWVARFIGNLNPSALIKNTSSFFADRNYEKQAEAIAKIYAQGDMESIRALKALRQLGPADERRYAVIGAILTRAGVFGGESALDNL